MTYLADPGSGGVLIAGTGRTTTIHVDPAESPAVRRAVRDLAVDLRKVCGCDTRLAPTAGGHRIAVGTVGVSPHVDAMIAAGRLAGSELRGADGSLRWEGFLVQVVDGCLYVVGADRRGTVFGIYDVCEAIGVSPWWFFADVPVRRRESIRVRADGLKADHPSVRYRGIFLNDEEQLEAWAAAHTADGTIGPETYARVFELVLRLKGNHVWPAMHVNHFNGDPENGRLAEEMGIVVGTSHCDMLLRSNQNEWRPWLESKGYTDVAYDYSVPGRNREVLQEYWRESVQQNQAYEVGWTVGMRGVHDSGFTTLAIDDAALSEEEKDRARVRLLEQVIGDQRAILREVLGEERGAEALQCFIPYKEVLPLYDAGLSVPEDVTVIWTDDDFGYVRRCPDESERARSGGHGLYYHSSYLAGTRDAHLTTSLEDHPRSWTHTQAETNGSGGLAMHVDARGLLWADPLRAPGMHYRVRVSTAGTYRVWLLVKHDSDDDDSCWLALDGTPQPLDAQFWGGDLFTFATTQVWCWTLLTDLEVGRGEHVLSVLARKSRLRIDRIYLTTGDEQPPADASWRSSARLAEQ